MFLYKLKAILKVKYMFKVVISQFGETFAN